jgi:hypothetical protein
MSVAACRTESAAGRSVDELAHCTQPFISTSRTMTPRARVVLLLLVLLALSALHTTLAKGRDFYKVRTCDFWP